MPCAYNRKRPKGFEDLGPGCQFDLDESRFFGFNGKRWCKFHLPMEDENGNKSPKASWRQGEVDLFNNEINGVMDSHIANSRDSSNVFDLSGVVFPENFSLERIDKIFSRDFKTFIL